MRRMVGRSINTAFVELNEEIGPDKTRQAAIDAGMPEGTRGLENDLGNVLGTASPHVIDMASAYSTIAAQGVRSTPYLIAKVTTADGSYSYTAKPKTRRAFAKEVTADVTDAMTYTTKPGGTATKIGREFDRPVASKTGTSEENLSKWFSGFVPQMAVSVGTLLLRPIRRLWQTYHSQPHWKFLLLWALPYRGSDVVRQRSSRPHHSRSQRWICSGRWSLDFRLRRLSPYCVGA